MLFQLLADTEFDPLQLIPFDEYAMEFVEDDVAFDTATNNCNSDDQQIEFHPFELGPFDPVQLIPFDEYINAFDAEAPVELHATNIPNSGAQHIDTQLY
jgi:hypothetical protein